MTDSEEEYGDDNEFGVSANELITLQTVTKVSPPDVEPATHQPPAAIPVVGSLATNPVVGASPVGQSGVQPQAQPRVLQQPQPRVLKPFNALMEKAARVQQVIIANHKLC